VLLGGLFCLIGPLLMGRDHGGAPWLWPVMLLGLPVLAGFLRLQRRIERKGGRPLLATALLLDRRFLHGLCSAFCFFSGNLSFYLVLTLFVQGSLAYSPWDAGLAVLPLAWPLLSHRATAWRGPARVAPQRLSPAAPCRYSGSALWRSWPIGPRAPAGRSWRWRWRYSAMGKAWSWRLGPAWCSRRSGEPMPAPPPASMPPPCRLPMQRASRASGVVLCRRASRIGSCRLSRGAGGRGRHGWIEHPLPRVAPRLAAQVVELPRVSSANDANYSHLHLGRLPLCSLVAPRQMGSGECMSVSAMASRIGKSAPPLMRHARRPACTACSGCGCNAASACRR